MILLLVVQLLLIPGWDEAADRKDSIYVHDENGGSCNQITDSCTEVQVTDPGTYRVNYGLSVTEGTISQARYQAISFVQNDTDGSTGYNSNDGLSCFDSSIQKNYRQSQHCSLVR